VTAVEVIVPWRSGCSRRAALLRWVLHRWASELPQFRLTVAEAPSGPWVKALAVMPAIEGSLAPVVIVADADVWIATDAVVNAVTTVCEGAAWAVPHLLVHRLTESATLRVLAGGPFDGPTTEPPYIGVASGGVVVLDRQVALDVPLDPRFEGWGGEDHAWGYALEALHGPPARGDADLWHLWHPPAPRIARHAGSMPSELLRRHYRLTSMGPVEGMRQLIAEVPKPWESSGSS